MKTPSRNEVLKVNILLRVAFNNSPTAIRANYYNVYYTVCSIYNTYNTTLPSIIRERDISPLFSKCPLSLSHTHRHARFLSFFFLLYCAYCIPTYLCVKRNNAFSMGHGVSNRFYLHRHYFITVLSRTIKP